MLLKDLDLCLLSGSFLYLLIVTNLFYHRMASNSGQGGIQQLLAAEQEAQRIVNAAKNGIVTNLHFLFLHVVYNNVI